MNTKVITVTSIVWPQAGKKMGAVIDNEGQRWGVWPDKLPGYQQFHTYEIGFKSNDFQGRTYHTIETAKPVGNGQTSRLIIPSSSATPNVVPMPPRQDTAMDDKRRMDIFVCGAFNNIMSNPNQALLSTSDMIAIVTRLKAVWSATLGPQAQETVERGSKDGELNDSIPF
jgi:hypothetical protein